MLRLFPNPRLQAAALIGALILAGSLWAEPAIDSESKAADTQDETVRAWILINNGSSGTLKPGSDPQTVEAVKTFAERCPDLGITMERNKADFTVLIGHDPHRPWWRRDNKIAVFDRNGGEIFSTSTRTMGNAVKDACRIITNKAQQAQSYSDTPSVNRD